jgi:hypothetical protein
MNYRRSHRERKSLVAQLKKNAERSLVHIIYYRPTRASCPALDGRLFDLAARYRGASGCWRAVRI